MKMFITPKPYVVIKDPNRSFSRRETKARTNGTFQTDPDIPVTGGIYDNEIRKFKRKDVYRYSVAP